MQMPQPNPDILQRKRAVLARLQHVLPQDAVIHEPSETRAYECDALTAYKCRRCLPCFRRRPNRSRMFCASATRKACRWCHAAPEHPWPVEPCQQRIGVILGVARMNDVLEVDYDNRFIKVQTGRTNLSVTGAVEEEDFFYAPDPSSQLACAIAGNIAMNSGGAHCLKYGVTTNNLLGVTMVMMDGTVLEIGGAYMDAGGLDLLGVICGSEGQLGVVTEATLRILRKPEGARPVLMGFDDNEVAGQCVSDIIKSAFCPWRSNSWTGCVLRPVKTLQRPVIPIARRC